MHEPRLACDREARWQEPLKHSPSEADKCVPTLENIKTEDYSLHPNLTQLSQQLSQRRLNEKSKNRIQTNKNAGGNRSKLKFETADENLQLQQCEMSSQDTQSAPSVFIKQEATSLSDYNPKAMTLLTVNESRRSCFPCTYPGCKETFSQKAHANVHLLNHAAEKPYACRQPGCFAAFFDKHHRSRHEKVHIPLNKRVKFHCTFSNCGRTFLFERSLNDHLNIHTGKKQYVCRHPGCEAAFAICTNRIRHERTHEADEIRNRFKCPYPGCGWSCLRADTLDCHLNGHSGVKPYVCDVPNCFKAYASCRSLWNHKNRSHRISEKPEALIPCEHPGCHVTFTKHKYMIEHMSREHQVERFQCDIPGCEFRFTSLSSRVLHYQRDHNMSAPGEVLHLDPQD